MAEATHPAGGFAPELLEEVGGQLLDVFWPLPEGGCPCLQDVEPMVEVLAKAPLPDGALQVDMGRGKHSDIHLALTLGAQAQEAVILEEAQQVDLKLEGEVADLVEEQGAPRGRLDDADLAPVGAGEGSLLVAEELRLDQPGGQCAAVDRVEGPRLPRRALVDQPCRQLLSRSGLPRDEHGGIHRGDLLDIRQQPPDGGGAADQGDLLPREHRLGKGRCRPVEQGGHRERALQHVMRLVGVEGEGEAGMAVPGNEPDLALILQARGEDQGDPQEVRDQVEHSFQLTRGGGMEAFQQDNAQRRWADAQDPLGLDQAACATKLPRVAG